jgi:ferredoxin-nitrite reductase
MSGRPDAEYPVVQTLNTPVVQTLNTPVVQTTLRVPDGSRRPPACSPMANKGFTGTQKQYLEGLASGLRVARGTARATLAEVRARFAAAGGLAFSGGWPSEDRAPGGGLPFTSSGVANGGAPDATAFAPGPSAPQVEPVPPHPDRAMWEAQDRFSSSGQRLSPQEKAKRRQPPHEMWPHMEKLARERLFPQGDDVFLYKFHGLFYVSPAEEAFMCRLRFAGGRLPAYQLRGVADLAERFGHPEVQLTTRSNLQLRGIQANAALEVLAGLAELGILNHGSGGDGVRNVRATPTSGFDRQELIETLPLARQAQQRILGDRSLQALPRKFTLAFDGGGSVSALAETCDLGFRAVTVGPGAAVAPGVYFRVLLGGATSHARYGRDAGVLVAPSQCLDVLEQVLHLYVEHGDRTNRRRARLAYLIETWGLPEFVAELQERLRRVPRGEHTVRGGSEPSGALPLAELPLDRCILPPQPDPLGHIGFHNQRPRGMSYVGVVLDSAHLSVEQARGLAQIAEDLGSGELRLTPQQNVIIPGLKDTQLYQVKEALERLGLAWTCSAFRTRLVACTGSPGCQFAKGDAKRRGEELVQQLSERAKLEQPLSIHISGCHHGCAAHTTADIGLMAVRDPAANDGAEFYQVWLGGELSDTAHFGRQWAASVPAAELSHVVQEVVDAYVSRRLPQESFREFIGRSPLREPERAKMMPERLREAGGLP